VLSLMLALSLAAAAPPPPACTLPDGTRVALELALNEREWATGLMFRDSLPPTGGMLFVFTADDRRPFWMKNTFIPLDMLWLDAKGAIVAVRADVQPCRSDPCPTYDPGTTSRAVLEVNAGFAAAHGLRVGVPLAFAGVGGYPAAGAKP